MQDFNLGFQPHRRRHIDLVRAIWVGRCDLVEELLRTRSDDGKDEPICDLFERQCGTRTCAFSLAIELRHRDIASALLLAHARGDCHGSLDKLVVELCSKGRTDAMEFLLRNTDLSVNRTYKWSLGSQHARTPLMMAACEGRWSLVRMLLTRQDMNINHELDNGENVLYHILEESANIYSFNHWRGDRGAKERRLLKMAVYLAAQGAVGPSQRMRDRFVHQRCEWAAVAGTLASCMYKKLYLDKWRLPKALADALLIDRGVPEDVVELIARFASPGTLFINKVLGGRTWGRILVASYKLPGGDLPRHYDNLADMAVWLEKSVATYNERVAVMKEKFGDRAVTDVHSVLSRSWC